MLLKTLLLLFLPLHLAASTLEIGALFRESKKGDWMVVVQNKNYTALHIVDKTPDSLIFDEMIIPEARVKQPFPGWRGWIQSEAPPAEKPSSLHRGVPLLSTHPSPVSTSPRPSKTFYSQ